MTPTQSCIHKLNVAWFEALLQQERSDKRRKVLSKLLADERVLLTEALRLEQREKSPDHPA